ncbi:MAG: hypothetical protein GXY32_02315 [Ruminococcaceae bacterium]|nr:hypothetical protein [Oscillospiraceae bacterium]
MPDYKAMYELLARQTATALRLLRQNRIESLYKAIDLLENTPKDAQSLYGELAAAPHKPAKKPGRAPRPGPEPSEQK